MRGLLAFAAAVASGPALAQDMAFVNATVVIGDGSAPIPDGTVVVRRGKVVAAGAGIAVPPGMSRIDAQTGSLVPGKMGDVVLWNGNPLSVYSRPEKVWVDGALLYDVDDPKRRPVSDFELGQPGEGDVK